MEGRIRLRALCVPLVRQVFRLPLKDPSLIVFSALPLSPSLEYQLFAFISHMGTSTMCGHYVCHIKKEGR